MSINWTVNDIEELKNKVAVVTGGNSGIGLEAVKIFTDRNAEVILACRSKSKGDTVAEGIRKENSAAKIRVMILDLADLDSVKSFSEEFLKYYDNFLFEDGKGYSPVKSYGRSKLSNLHFTYELQRRLEKAGVNVKSLAAHPGSAETNLERHVEDSITWKLMTPLRKVTTHSPFEASLPGIRAATDSDLKGGEFIGPDGFMGLTGKPVVIKSNKHSYMKEDAAELWGLSEKLTGVSFTI